MFKGSAIEDYLSGMSYRAVGEKYGVDHKTVRYWVIKNGNKSRTKKEANIIAGKKLRGVRRSPSTEFKKGQMPWNEGTIGVTAANKTSFKKGERSSIATEFKKGKEHLCYIDGRGYGRYPSKFNAKLKSKMRKRDGHECKNCEMSEKQHLIDYKRRLEVHHIDYDRQNCNESNLITLCKKCNMLANSDRIYWEKYYKSKIKEMIYE